MRLLCAALQSRFRRLQWALSQPQVGLGAPTPNPVELAIRGFDSLLGLLSARSRCSDLPYDNYDNQSSPHGHSSRLPLSYEHRVVMREFEPARPRRAAPPVRVSGGDRLSPVSTRNKRKSPPGFRSPGAICWLRRFWWSNFLLPTTPATEGVKSPKRTSFWKSLKMHQTSFDLPSWYHSTESMLRSLGEGSSSSHYNRNTSET